MNGSLRALLEAPEAGNDLSLRLLETLRAMFLAGHRPSPALLVRLTDGRVRLLAGENSRDALVRVQNEFGPAARAFEVGSRETAEGVLLFVDDLVRGGGRRQRCLERGPGSWELAPAEQTDSVKTAAPAVVSDRFANFARSMGLALAA